MSLVFFLISTHANQLRSSFAFYFTQILSISIINFSSEFIVAGTPLAKLRALESDDGYSSALRGPRSPRARRGPLEMMPFLSLSYTTQTRSVHATSRRLQRSVGAESGRRGGLVDRPDFYYSIVVYIDLPVESCWPLDCHA